MNSSNMPTVTGDPGQDSAAMERVVKEVHGSKVGDGDMEDWETVRTGEHAWIHQNMH